MSSIEMAPVWRQTILNNTFVTCPVKEASHGGQVKTMTMEEHPVNKETFPVLLMGNKFDVVSSSCRHFLNKKIFPVSYLSLEKKKVTEWFVASSDYKNSLY